MTSSRYLKTKGHRKKTSKTLKKYFQSPEGIKARKKLSEFGKLQTGEKSTQWKGGRIIQNGYIKVMKKDHPHANGDGYVQEHRLVMEKMAGRYLKPSERVHHIDRNRKNNNPSNLLLCKDISEHSKITFSAGYISQKERYYLFFITYLLKRLVEGREI